MDISEFTEQNRRAWNEIAEVREQAHLRTGTFKAMSFWASGGVALPAEVEPIVGDLKGRAVLHLMCATGRDSLSLANLGASVTGVDISDEEIAIARRNADEAGLSVRFVAADVYALPGDLQAGNFDLVYTSGGVLCWLPDIRRWAEVVARALAPGGRLILNDEHPVATCMWVTDGQVRFEFDYFTRHSPLVLEPGWSFFDDSGVATQNKVEFSWPLGDIVTAVAQAGLRVDALHESPPTPNDRWRWKEHLEHAHGIPGRFVLVATQPDAASRKT